MRSLPLALLLLSGAGSASPLSSLVLDLEVGPLYVFQNDGRYGENGTPFEKSDVGQDRNLALSKRFEVGLWFGERHGLELLYAPLEITTTFQLDEPLVFRETTFEAGEVLDHRYLFDGYRATYLYKLVHNDRLTFAIGGAFQVRNAAVEFTAQNSDRHSIESDVGLVFAPSVVLRYDFPWDLWAEFELTALSTFGLLGDTEGGIVDTALTLGLPVLEDEADFFFRLRFYGGGAEVPDRDFENWGYFGIAAIGLRADLVPILD